MPNQPARVPQTVVQLPEANAAHLFAHRIVERLDSNNSTQRMDVSAIIGSLASNAQIEVEPSEVSASQETTSNRIIIGIVGAPGAGKSTVTAEIAEVLHERGIDVAVLAMDGFHLSNRQLARLGLSAVKGAPQSFDAAGFVAALRRVASHEADVYVPVFHREIEESYAADGLIPASAQVVLVEGNYLLLDSQEFEDFARVRHYLTESWFLQPDESTRIDRLVLRHVRHGKEPQAAIDWALGPDQRNAELIHESRTNASLVVELL